MDAGSGESPPPQTLETGLRRLADGDQGVLDRLARRDAGYRRARGRAVPAPGRARTRARRPTPPCSRCAPPDRPGLLHAIGTALAAVGVDLRSAHVATHAGQAVDVLYVAEPGGRPLAPARVAATVAALVDAGTLPEDDQRRARG